MTTTTTTGGEHRPDALDKLAAQGPFAEQTDALMLYGQFVGSWDMRSTWFGPDGTRAERQGEWHFAWVLGGRGVQDVLFVAGAPAHEYGTSLRCYDTDAGIWWVTWMQPCAGEFVTLAGRRFEDRIVQEGQALGSERLERWTFSEITRDSFLWSAETSADAGETWSLEQQMRGHRRGLREG